MESNQAPGLFYTLVLSVKLFLVDLNVFVNFFLILCFFVEVVLALD